MHARRCIPRLWPICLLSLSVLVAGRCGGQEGAVLTVARDGSGPHATVQKAIDAAAPGAIVRVGPGVYSESLAIKKPVTLEGAGWEKTRIAPGVVWGGSTEEAAREYRSKLKEAGGAVRKVREWLARKYGGPTLAVRGTDGVVVRGLTFTALDAKGRGRTLAEAIVELERSRVRLEDCVVAGGEQHGVAITEGSEVELRRCLVAAVWRTGVVVGGKSGDEVRARIVDCDVRNCRYAGIRIGRTGGSTIVERCRVSGAAWHGIRYDDVSPVIAESLIFGNARCGIYASGRTEATVRGNVFFRNEMNGMSCWFHNRDRIEGDTFVGNLREGLSVLGASEPAVRRNIFHGNPVAIVSGPIKSDDDGAKLTGKPAFSGNLFSGNERICVVHGPDWGEGEERELGAGTQSVTYDPQFRDADACDFGLAAESPARAAGIGVADPIPLESPWPLLPEEKAIIPDGETRDSRQWKKPGEAPPARGEVRVARSAGPKRPEPAARTTGILSVLSLIDGSDILKLTRDRVWFEHESSDPPGKWQGRNEPTFVDGKEWTPAWRGKTCEPLEGLALPLPLPEGKELHVESIRARGSVYVLEQPSDANGHAASIFFDDRRLSGADWYEIVVDIRDVPPPVDEGGEYAWQRTDAFVPPSFTRFFPDDPAGGEALDRVHRALGSDTRPDKEILDIVRRGLRRTRNHRTSILRTIGNRYIWGKRPQNPYAVELMYHASDPDDRFGTRHYAVYFGLSVLASPKPPNVLRTLVDVCMKGGDVGRVSWGCKGQFEGLRQFLPPYLESENVAVRERAEALDKHFRGEIKFQDWEGQRKKEAAKAEYGERLPEFRNMLLSGSSEERWEVIKLCLSTISLMSLMDDTFLEAWAACGEDPSRKVRAEVARLAGGRWVWGNQKQLPEAVDLMLDLSQDEDRGVRYNAVYFGLSVVHDKSEEVIDRLIEMAAAAPKYDGNLHGRIAWGLKREKARAAAAIEAFVAAEGADGSRSEEILSRLYREITGTDL